MLLTVLLIAAASSMSAALIRQSQVKTSDLEAKTAISGTRQAAETLLREAEALMSANPDLVLGRVLPAEASRTCLYGSQAGDSFSAGSVWPSSCGTQWSYETVDGEWTGSQLEYRMPSAAESTLSITARVRFQTGLTTTLTGTYIRDMTGKVSLGVTSGPAVTSSVDVDGGLYAHSDKTTSFDSQVSSLQR